VVASASTNRHTRNAGCQPKLRFALAVVVLLIRSASLRSRYYTTITNPRPAAWYLQCTAIICTILGDGIDGYWYA
jgi:hypothetical protein